MAGRLHSGRHRPFQSCSRHVFSSSKPEQLPGLTKPVSLQVWETGFIMISTPDTNTTRTGACVGIDVAKASLDIFAENTNQTWSVKNEPKQFAALIRRLQALAPKRIIVEASGGYETNLVVALASAGLPVCLVNPKRVRDFAKGVGQLAKTDQLDARVLAFFGRVVAPYPDQMTGSGIFTADGPPCGACCTWRRWRRPVGTL